MSLCHCHPSSSFHNIRGKLMCLPDTYRFWQPKLENYLADFDFMHTDHLRSQAARHRMTLDYLRSLFELHRPIGLFREQHFLILGQVTGFICEAILLDYTLSKLQTSDPILVKQITKRPMFGTITEWLEHDLVQCPRKHKRFLTAIKEVRNSVHLKKAEIGMRQMKERYLEQIEYTSAKTGKTRKIKVTRPEQIIDDLESFIDHIRSLYTHS